MTKNVYIIQKWINNGWSNLHCYTSERKAKAYIAQIAFTESVKDYRIFQMTVL